MLPAIREPGIYVAPGAELAADDGVVISGIIKAVTTKANAKVWSLEAKMMAILNGFDPNVGGGD